MKRISKSKKLQLNKYDLKSIWLYFLAIFWVSILANLSELQKVLDQYISAENSALIVAMIWIVLKKLVQGK